MIYGAMTNSPNPEPGKDHSNPTNYRFIALTSCMCKTMDRMINVRLVLYLEKHNLLSGYQSVFQKNQGNNHQLVGFESFIRDSHARNHFDLEKPTILHGNIES